MDGFLVNPRPKPQPKHKPKPANLMEEVISIKHDESVVENPCLHTVAREWAARLDVSPMAASQMIVAFWQLPARPYKPQQRPLPERVSLAEEALVRTRCRSGSSRATSSRAAGPSRKRGATGGPTSRAFRSTFWGGRLRSWCAST